MKANKINFDWKSVIFGMVLCLTLVVFVGSMAHGNQVENQTGVIQKTVTMNELMAKCELIDQRVLVLEGKINVVQERADQAVALLKRMNKSGK